MAGDDSTTESPDAVTIPAASYVSISSKPTSSQKITTSLQCNLELPQLPQPYMESYNHTHLQQIIDIAHSVFGKYYGDRPEHMKHVIKEGHLVVAYISYYEGYGGSHISELAVRPTHQNQGHGKLLITAAISDLTLPITLFVDETLHRLPSYYAKFGFELDGKSPCGNIQMVKHEHTKTSYF